MKPGDSLAIRREVKDGSQGSYNEAGSRRAGSEDAWHAGSLLRDFPADLIASGAQRPWDDGSNFRSYFPPTPTPVPSSEASS